MGRVHKKKLVELTEAAENELSKNINVKQKREEVVEKDKDVDVEQETCAGFDSNDDDPIKSMHSTDDGNISGTKKSTKRKSGKTEKKSESHEDILINALDSEDEPLNGGSLKKSRKSRITKTKKAKITTAGKKTGRNNPGEKVAKNIVEAADEEYEVKEIVDHKIEDGISYFLIRWKGFLKEDDSWEAENTLSCPDLIEKFKKKLALNPKSPKKSIPLNKKKQPDSPDKIKSDPNKEWEVDKIVDYADDKNGRKFRIRWKGFSAKYDTWEPENHLNCDDIIKKFMERMKSQENITFKELREEPKKTKRLVNETTLPTSYHNPISRKSKRTVSKKRVYYGDSDGY